MKTKQDIANRWIEEANFIGTELSKTLLIVSATLLVFSAAIPVSETITNDSPEMYRIPWVLILLSLASGIGYNLVRSLRLRVHASRLLHDQSDHNVRQEPHAYTSFVTYPFRIEMVLSALQPTLLICGLGLTGYAILW